MKDFYTRSSFEVKYDPDKLEQENELQIYIQKIKMLIFTKPTDVFGQYGMGINLESLLFNKSLTNDQVSSLINKHLSTHCDEFYDFPTTIDVKFYSQVSHDECEINININGYRAITVKNF